jgi:predicted nucleic acid-binding protein
MILIDAGPMVALISASDNHHESCRAALESIAEPIATVWPAFTEAMYLLRSSWPAQRALWEMIERGTIDLHYLNIDDVRRMRELMEKYRDLPMDLADAALVRVAEREKIRRIFTLDRRDFSVYRPVGVGRFTLLPAGRKTFIRR